MTAVDSVFVDTNVLLYTLSENEPPKQTAARGWIVALWNTGAGRISWQVLNEYYSKAVGKLAVPPSTARSSVRHLMEWNPEPFTPAMLERAWHWCDSSQANYWDALIIAAAEQSGCRWLLTEDLQTGRRYGTVTVVNPFKHEPAEFGLS